MRLKASPWTVVNWTDWVPWGDLLTAMPLTVLCNALTSYFLVIQTVTENIDIIYSEKKLRGRCASVLEWEEMVPESKTEVWAKVKGSSRHQMHFNVIDSFEPWMHNLGTGDNRSDSRILRQSTCWNKDDFRKTNCDRFWNHFLSITEVGVVRNKRRQQ